LQLADREIALLKLVGHVAELLFQLRGLGHVAHDRGTAMVLAGTDALRITTRPHAITDKPDAKKIEISKGQIEFRDVRFSFSGHPIFNPLNMSIQGGEKIAIVGPSGSGKSTFVSCLLRLYDLEDGAILIDSQSIADVTQDSLHDAIAVIPQDTSLFHRSLMENIRYGRRDATDEEVFEASKKAFAHDFIATLPDG